MMTKGKQLIRAKKCWYCAFQSGDYCSKTNKKVDMRKTCPNKELFVAVPGFENITFK